MKNNDFKLISDFIKGAISILKALFTVFCSGLKTAYTAQNSENSDASENFLECNYEKCTGCEICTGVCPSNGALIVKSDEQGLKKLTVIDISKCIFCKNCIYNCPYGALNVTKQYKLATNDKKDLKLDCKKIYEAKLKELAKTADIPAFVNEEEI